MTLATHTPRRVNPAAALANAEDDFETEVRAMYEVPRGTLPADLLELQAIATITARYAADMDTLLNRLHYAKRDQAHPFIEYLLDQVDDALDHGAGAVVRAHVKMEASK
jgi:hypothetical protein